MTSVPFTIDQSAGLIYNSDSLLYGTNVSKVKINLSSEGIPSIYVDSTGVYDSLPDSIDFTSPRKFRVYSNDAACYKDYTVSVNVHQVDPELMVWEKMNAPEGVSPLRALEFGGEMCLFGNDATGSAVVAKIAPGETVWGIAALSGLPTSADLSTVHLFNDKLYAVADGNIYSSQDAVEWSLSADAVGAVAIIGSSDVEGLLWVAGEDGIKYSSDGILFTLAEALPQNFPLYGVSAMSYRLAHHEGIIRYMLVGYSTAAKEGNASVWCKLSNESRWTCYDNKNNLFPCPALKDVTVLHYDNFLYALGGAGTVDGVEKKALSAFFVSKDNGIVWKENESFYQRLPKELSGNNAPFAATVDSKNYMWIVSGAPNGGVWKGIINRLGFNK